MLRMVSKPEFKAWTVERIVILLIVNSPYTKSIVMFHCCVFCAVVPYQVYIVVKNKIKGFVSKESIVLRQ